MKTIRRALQAAGVAMVLIAIWCLSWEPAQAQSTDPNVPDPWMDIVYTSQGQTFNVPINFGTLIGIRSFQFDLTFNPAVLRLNSVSEGGYLSSFATAHGGSITVTPASIDNVNGRATGFAVALNGAPGQSDSDTGVIAILNFTALANGKNQTNLSNLIFLDVHGNPIQPIVATGGLVWVGTPPMLEVTSLQLTPEGVGLDYGFNFGVSFTITNTGGLVSDPATAFIYPQGGLPPANQPALDIPALAPGASISFSVPGYQLVAAQADVEVGMVGGSTRTAVYRYDVISSHGETPIDALVVPLIKITPDAAVNFGNLELGTNKINGTITVQCNTAYEVDVEDTGLTTAWHMTEYNGSSYDPANRLQDPLSLQAAGFNPVTTPGGMLLIGGPSGQGSGDIGQTFPVGYSQTLHYCDPMPAQGDTYHIVLSFNGFITL